jgi:hypothetical protein
MERSGDTLSTRDLAQPDEPAKGRGAVADSTGDGPEGGSVYDNERAAQDEAAGSVPAREQTRAGTRADEADRGAAAPPGVDAAPAAGDEEGAVATESRQDQAGGTTTSGVGTEPGSTTDQDEPVPPQHSNAPAGGTDSAGDPAPLLSAEASSSFQQRWEEVQTRFVDEPRGAVEQADGLVANLMQQLAEGFAQERERLEAQWDRGEDISTEELRVALQRYRSFFQRLLSA